MSARGNQNLWKSVSSVRSVVRMSSFGSCLGQFANRASQPPAGRDSVVSLFDKESALAAAKKDRGEKAKDEDDKDKDKDKKAKDEDTDDQSKSSRKAG